jgi:hypothetical protein
MAGAAPACGGPLVVCNEGQQGSGCGRWPPLVVLAVRSIKLTFGSAAGSEPERQLYEALLT